MHGRPGEDVTSVLQRTADLVLQVTDLDLVGALVQHREAVARNEHCRGAQPPLRLLWNSNRDSLLLHSPDVKA